MCADVSEKWSVLQIWEVSAQQIIRRTDDFFFFLERFWLLNALWCRKDGTLELNLYRAAKCFPARFDFLKFLLQLLNSSQFHN